MCAYMVCVYASASFFKSLLTFELFLRERCSTPVVGVLFWFSAKEMESDESQNSHLKIERLSVFIFWLKAWFGGISRKGYEMKRISFGVKMLCTTSHIVRDRCNAYPLRGVARRNWLSNCVFVLPLDEVVTSRAVIVIVSGSNGRTSGRAQTLWSPLNNSKTVPDRQYVSTGS